MLVVHDQLDGDDNQDDDSKDDGKACVAIKGDGCVILSVIVCDVLYSITPS